MTVPNVDYHRRRHLQELERANLATSPAIGNIHRELAHYHKLAAERPDPVKVAVALDR